MRCYAVILTLAVAMALLSAAAAEPAPRPGLVPVEWELQFTCQTPRQITLRLPGDKDSKTFWYVLYTVTNRTGADRIFVPDFVLYTDTGKVYRAGDRIPSAAFQAIQKRHNNPLLVNIAAVTGPLLQSADNAKDGVAIWPDFDHKARGFDIFAAGLSGERAVVKLPKPIVQTVMDEDGNKTDVTRTEVILSKTLHLQYSLPGEAAARSRVTPRLIRKDWVMR